VVNDEADDWVDVTCSVIDTGIGIPDEQKKKLFLPFSQIESSSSRSYGGTGLGLSICKALIENVMHGKVWLDSTPGVGTTVSFSLRFQKVAKAQARDRQYTREPDPMAKFSSQENNGHEPQSGTCIDLSTIPRNELRICIAEDNLINQRIAISFVQKLGFKCDAYLDGFKTIDALERASDNGRPFHLVLMDVQMPHCDGYEGTSRLFHGSSELQLTLDSHKIDPQALESRNQEHSHHCHDCLGDSRRSRKVPRQRNEQLPCQTGTSTDAESAS
jgi:CheY-like chemotaxis protein